MPSRDALLQERLNRFGDAVRTARLTAGFTQEELAHRAGLHRTYIGSVERGERNVSLASAWTLADALNIPLTRLLEGS